MQPRADMVVTRGRGDIVRVDERLDYRTAFCTWKACVMGYKSYVIGSADAELNIGTPRCCLGWGKPD
jgi:hypothetical protein